MRTIVSTFDNSQTAQKAVEQLPLQGFPRAAIRLLSSHDGYEAPTPTGNTIGATRTDLMESFGTFFGNLFHGDESADQAGKYSEAVSRGSTLIAVDAADEFEVDKARTLMSEQGSIDIDQRTDKCKDSG